jgi:malonate transporter
MGSDSSMAMIVNSIFPVVALIVLGVFLRRYRITNETFLRTSDRLIYFIFFPAMLFWKIGSPSSGPAVYGTLTLAVLCTLFAVYLLSLLYVKVATIPDFKVGSFCQGCCRFNTYVGMAIILTALGDEGVRAFGVIIGVVIPFINLLVVPTLIWFSGESYSLREKVVILFKAVLSNPLILGCVLGISYGRLGIPFPVSVDNTFRMLSMVALPMALISIGGSLTLTVVKGHLKLALVTTFFKHLVLPALGYLVFRLFQITGLPFQVGMIYFALPTSTAAYILSSQLKSDIDLAAAAILLSTILSLVSLSAVMLLLVA